MRVYRLERPALRSLFVLMVTIFGTTQHAQAEFPTNISTSNATPTSTVSSAAAVATPNASAVALPRSRVLTAGSNLKFAAQMSQGANSVGCAASSSQPAPIVALASALKCEPDLIFEYVRNNIEFEPLYGSHKGALGTLLDRKGDDADQCILLAALLSAAGVPAAQIGYNNAVLPLTGDQAASWLGVPNDALAIEGLLNVGGIPHANEVVSGNTLTSISVLHFFLGVQVNGTWYYYDPSFKPHTKVTGLGSTLGSALGYTRTQFLSDAGGTIAHDSGGSLSGSITNLNRANVRADLTTFASNLVNYINQNNRAWTMADVVGGNTIVPVQGTAFAVAQQWTPPSQTFPVYCPNQSPSNVECRTYVSVTMPGATSDQSIKLYTDEVYGHRVSVDSEMGTTNLTNYEPWLRIDGTVPACYFAKTCSISGTETAPGTTWSIQTNSAIPNRPNRSATLTILAGGQYLIAIGVGQVGRGMAEYHRQLLAQGQARNDGTVSITGESLAVISYNWLAEVSAQQQLNDQLAQTTTTYPLALGIVGYKNFGPMVPAVNWDKPVPYVDLPVNLVNSVPRQSGGSTQIGSYQYQPAFVSSITADSQALSAFESAVLLQTQASIPGMVVASTMALVDDNVNSSYAGDTGVTYFADGTTQSGKNYFTSVIAPAISNNYSQADYNRIVSLVAQGDQLLIPKNGKLSVGLWTGGGYTDISLVADQQLGVGQIITGGMSGGFSGTPDLLLGLSTLTSLNPTSGTSSVISLVNLTPSPLDIRYADPVDGITGAYTYKHDDLVTGEGGFPKALSFSRSYNSSSGSNLTTPSADTGMGAGWAHNYSITVNVASDPYAGMGSASTPAINSATSIAALYVMHDLLSQQLTAQNMTLSSLVARWFTDQLTSNIATVSRPDTIEQYVALPQGDNASSTTYTAPRGSPAILTRNSSGAFTYTDKDGSQLNFDALYGRLQSSVFPNGMKVALHYQYQDGSGLLTSITNSVGRSLTLTYSGNPVPNDVIKVTDDSGRFITYGYDSNHNLTSYTDPLNKSTTFAYDTTGTYDTVGHLTKVFYPALPSTPFVTNWYDPMGRVIQQANGNNNFTHFYIAGSRSEIVDGMGNRSVTYQTDRGLITTQVQVVGTPTTEIFGGATQVNNVMNVTTNQYDGLDRLTMTTLPEGNWTSYVYDNRSNVLSVTNHAKTGSGLADIVTSSTYGAGPTIVLCGSPICNKTLTQTNGRGYVTSYNWNPTTGLPTCIITGSSAAVTSCGAGTPYPETDFGYAAYSMSDGASVSLLTSTAKKIDTSHSLTTNYNYDPSNKYVLLSATVDPNGLNLTTSWTFDPKGNLLSVTDPRTNVSNNVWDADRRLVFSISPATTDIPTSHPSIATKYTYDDNSEVVQVDQGTTTSTTGTDFAPLSTVTSVYDAAGNKTQVATPSSVTQYSYDADGRVLCTAVRMNRNKAAPYTFGTFGVDACTLSPTATSYGADRITENIYDAAGHLRQIVLALGATNPVTNAPLQQTYATYKYSPNGKLLAVADANANIAIGVSSADALNENAVTAHQTDYYYDGFDRLQQATFADSSYERLTYDNDNNVVSRTNRSGQFLTYTFDSLDHVCKKVMQSSNTTPLAACNSTAPSSPAVTTTLAYDLAGEVISTSDTLGNSLANVYDLAGRLTQNTNTVPGLGAKSVNYQYDAAGNRTRLTWDDSYYVNYAYDAANRMNKASDSTGATLAAYDFDQLGHPTNLQYAGSGATASRTWSTEGDLQSLTHALNGNPHYVDFTDTYTPAHQINDSTITNPAFEYRVSPGSTTNYATVNGLNQYTSVTPPGGTAATLIYDRNGNLTNDPTAGFTYTYDAENRLMTATATPTGVAATYAYDPLGRRTTKTVAGGSYAGTTYFLDSGDDEIAEYGGSGNLLRRYIPGPGVDQPIAMIDCSAATPPNCTGSGAVKTFFHQDKTGSVIATSNSDGSIAEGPFIYDAFGNGAPLTGVPYKYTGRRLDPETGLYYYRARYYSASQGRFLQTDPIGYAGGANLYAYTDNDPLNRTDPQGLQYVQLGVAGNGKGWFSLNGEVGIAVGRGGVALYSTIGAGAISGAGEEGSVGGHLTFSPSGSVANLSGYAVDVGAQGGEGLVGGVDVAHGANPEDWAYGVSFGAGGGTLIGGGVSGQYTAAVCLTCVERTPPPQPSQPTQGLPGWSTNLQLPTSPTISLQNPLSSDVTTDIGQSQAPKK